MALEKLIEYKKMLDRAIELIETYPKLQAEVESLKKQLKEKKKAKKEIELELKDLNKKLAEAGFSVKIEEIMKEPVTLTPPKTVGILQTITKTILDYKAGEIFRRKDVYEKFPPEIKEKYPDYLKVEGNIGKILNNLIKKGEVIKIRLGTYKRVGKTEEVDNPSHYSEL
ncbi:MAG: hypothetical protein QXS37_04965 [Candidatus Aenigmatarchaeota archaeon]